MKDMILKELTQNNLKNISFTIPKNKIVIFTGVSGSGKSSIVFDTIAAESQRQMNETYPSFIRAHLPKYKKPQVGFIDNLTASVIVNQSPIGRNVRSTVGTVSDLYSSLRLLFSRVGEPYVGTAAYFSFNNPNGMCENCSGLGRITTIDIENIIDLNKSWNEGCVKDSLFMPGTRFWKQYAESELFDLDKPIRDYSDEEYNLLIYGSRDGKGDQEHANVTGIYYKYSSMFLNRDISNMSQTIQSKAKKFSKEKECPHCKGKRLKQAVLNCKISGYSIADMCEMELIELQAILKGINDNRAQELLTTLLNGIQRIIDIGLPYLHLNRETPTLSGGEAQRLKLVRYMGSSLSGMTYIFDEPSTGMHSRDVDRMKQLLKKIRDKGNSVLVVEHDKDVISIGDEIIDIGPNAGKQGGQIVFQGSYDDLLKSDTLTARSLKKSLPVKECNRKANGNLSIKNANLHNLKSINVDIPLGIMTVVTGVAGSGKSTLISRVFAKQYEKEVVMIDQSPITAINRSIPATFLGFFDDIRKILAKENKTEESIFSFNSKGACKVCKGKGVIVTEVTFMDPIITECENCLGTRYSKEALSYLYRGKNIIEILSMTISEALEFFEDKKIVDHLERMQKVGLSYMTLGQPLDTLSGGERQRIKLAKHLGKKGDIYIFDEPTTGLHMSDIEKILILFEKMVEDGSTVIIIEHNLDVIKQADWIIDIGPDGGKNGGEVVFMGTPIDMIKSSNTITAQYLRKDIFK